MHRKTHRVLLIVFFQLKKILLLTFLLALASMPGWAENHWQRVVVNYTRQQYHSGNQNWQASQSKEGWMYFANNKGLLEYDGNTWQTYPLPGNVKVRAVRTSGDTIYVGALGQFGLFTRNPKGQLIYQRLSESVDRAGQLNIWNIHQIGHDIYYQGTTSTTRATIPSTSTIARRRSTARSASATRRWSITGSMPSGREVSLCSWAMNSSNYRASTSAKPLALSASSPIDRGNCCS